MRPLKSLEKAYLGLAQLDPLEEDAGQNEIEQLQYLYRIAGLVHLQTSGLLAASGIEPDDDEWAALEFPDQNVPPTPQERLTEIIQHNFFDSPNDAEYWIPRIVQSPVKASMLQQEQVAFLHLFQGYNKANSINDLIELLGSDDYTGTFDALFQRIVNIENNAHNPRRLLARFHISSDLEADSRVHKFLHAMLGTIQAIKFAEEWDQMDNRGKQQYREEMFNVIYPFHNEVDTAIQKRHKATFASRHNKVVKSRQDTKKLFQKLSSWIPSGTQQHPT
ncbi:hypothetical protein JR316_0013131 [Psilocybe cubensis]|uniref:Uncharacterized protein n=2 Tax=Psilocybe cubensis TaxID=181762 RepID=A0A8H7XU79_PSICU|nr:hypothetical protein JR316_0013131 [Psilocybe cubensis]KAH9474667.1 hypothetical protein JR316_0013131 [Psilocybe cubensis]